MIFQTKVTDSQDVPDSLILQADPDKSKLDEYRKTCTFLGRLADSSGAGDSFIVGNLPGTDNSTVTEGTTVVGAIGFKTIRENTMEIACLAVLPNYRGAGHAAELVEAVIAEAEAQGLTQVIVKTGNSSIPALSLYQRCGFRITSINKDYFINKYPHPIYEAGIQCRDQIVLEYHIYSEDQKADMSAEYWSEFTTAFPEYKDAAYESWPFGYTNRLANKLLGYVLDGRKTGTSSAKELYAPDEKIPEAGDLSIITNGSGVPGCVIITEEIHIKPFHDITEEEARLEGEGDLSLVYWRAVHEEFFRKEYRDTQLSFTTNIPVIYEIFRVLWASPYGSS